MSLWDHLFDSEYKQRADIESLKQMSRKRMLAQSRGDRMLNDQQGRIERLEEQVGELALLCRTLLTILREQDAVDPERFEQVMQQIDAEDGLVDGQFTPRQDQDEPDDPETPEIHAW